jgi:putative transposase
MRRSRYKEDQIIGMLKERQAGLWRRNCGANGISDATFYKWRSKYEENQLKKLLAESMPYTSTLKEMLRKNV